MFQFAWAWAFLLLPLPILIYLFVKPIEKKQAAIIIPFYQQMVQSANESIFVMPKNRWISLVALSLIWALFISAVARPEWVDEPISLSRSGRDLLVAVDISDSMDQPDMVLNGQSATRLQVVKQVVSDFIERRQGDRIGLILFGTNAYLQAPLTFDTNTVAQFLEEAQLGFAGPKTAIGDAIGLSVKRLQELGDATNNRVVILLTDGANTAGEVEPLQAAALAKQTAIKIHTVGIGADEMVVRGLFGPRRINPSAQLDEKTLVNIANSTGGKYFRARETSELMAIYQELDQLEPALKEQQWLRPTQSLFIWPLSLAFLLSLIVAASKLHMKPVAIKK